MVAATPKVRAVTMLKETATIELTTYVSIIIRARVQKNVQK